ncbi:DUF262 domain-containing protein [Tolypothrix sp. FACHB-123]|uniref:DUF262 domain-containing protein n=1 Tax=Tolypothrix sp. FACHB-123 TaxID=2692868 RepID=UPI00168702E0|nr:DUF262 domain-containing protein [Tolypothrix sp. FACHB-123]MBD2358145.1 DUF262 domain-containing protein [Tolypothrix sp. FACHB-123]
MPKIFYPSSEKLKYLLESIHQREVALPDFQRDFVWEPRSTEELIESICQNYPAGSLLRIRNSKGFYFVPREFAGAPELKHHAPSYLILDGQQRLTSLYHAFYGTGNHCYFINLQKLIDDQDLEDCIFYLNNKEADKKFGSLQQQANALVFPLKTLFGVKNGFEKWLDEIIDLRPETGGDRVTLKAKLREVKESWLEPAEEYEFPVVTLDDNTSAAAVCTIFETLNRTGVKLSVFDLLAARFWTADVRLRDLWDIAKTNYPIIVDFEIDPYYILQAITIYTASTAPSCKRNDVLKMNVDQIKIGWNPIVKALAEILQMLRDDCGVILPQWLPYYTILIPAAATLAAVSSVTGPSVGAIRNKLKRWFWCSVFGQTYENSPNSQSVKDYSELKQWIAGGAEPQTVSNFSFDINLLRQTTPRQRAVYRGVIALILRHGAQDFHKGGRITASMMLDKKIDDHHIFPQAFLKDKFPSVSSTLRDCVLNRTLIDKDTNIRISKRAPSNYLQEIEQTIGTAELQTILRSHMLPDTPTSALCQDKFEDFLNERQQLIAAELETVTQ